MACFIVGIAGATGSGKTTIAEKLADAVAADAVLLQHDSYYRDRPDLSPAQRDALNFDHPDALDTTLLVQQLQDLRDGKGIGAPMYDFTTHRRKPEVRWVESAPIVLVEGILVLADDALRRMLDVKVFVDTDSDIRAFRRIRRDIQERGRSFDSIAQQYFDTVRPMTQQFVEPSKRWADIIIPEGGRNDVALDLLVAKLRSVVKR